MAVNHPFQVEPRQSPRRIFPLSLGALVAFKLGIHENQGRVIEDRGNIGFGGRHLVAIRFPEHTDPDNQMTIELPIDELTVVPAGNGH